MAEQDDERRRDASRGDLAVARGDGSPAVDGGWGEATTGGSSRIRRLLVVVLVLAMVLLGWAGALALRASTAMQRVEVEGLAAYDVGPLNVLVVGSDSRAELDPDQQDLLTTGGDSGPERTDTILVLSFARGRAAEVSFPRDLWVSRCDGRAQRLNTAVQVGGLGCLAQTIEDVAGIEIHHTVSVSFLGFVDVVEAVGGVGICLPDPIRDADAGLDLPAGCQTLDGVDSLGYVRVRKIDDDLRRIERQQRFVSALAAEVADPATVLLPTRTWATAGAVGGALTADQGLTAPRLLRMAWIGRGLPLGRVVRVTVPTQPTTRGSAQVLVPAPDAEELFAAVRDGSLLDRPSTQQELRGREQVEVVVLNGAERSGLGGATAQALAAQGYDVLDVGNADRTPQSVVRHPPDRADEAERLADDLAQVLGVRPQVAATGDDVATTVVLGTDAGG